MLGFRNRKKSTATLGKGCSDILKMLSHISNGRTIAEAAARVRSWVWQVGFVVDKLASGQVFSEYFDFPCQKPFIPPTSPSSSSSSSSQLIREK
jgi:hypothetical protein